MRTALFVLLCVGCAADPPAAPEKKEKPQAVPVLTVAMLRREHSQRDGEEVELQGVGMLFGKGKIEGMVFHYNGRIAVVASFQCETGPLSEFPLRMNVDVRLRGLVCSGEDGDPVGFKVLRVVGAW